MDACPRVLQDTVQVGKTVANQLVVTLNICDNVKETANCGLGLFLVNWLIKQMSLLVVICVEELTHSLGSFLLNHLLLLELVQFICDGLYLNHLAEKTSLLLRVFPVSKVTAIHQDTVRMLLSVLG